MFFDDSAQTHLGRNTVRFERQNIAVSDDSMRICPGCDTVRFGRDEILCCSMTVCKLIQAVMQCASRERKDSVIR